MNKFKTRLKQLKIIIKYYYYKIYCAIKKIENDDTWIISERGKDARDNGYVFFKYLRENYPEKKVFYIIDKNSCDYEKVAKLENVIDYGSKEHYILFITSKILISTHLMGFSPDMGLFNKLQKNNLLRINGKIVSLKHGITKDYLPQLNPKDTKLSLLIAGAKPEYEYILEKFGFTEKEVKYTGFARFDNLVSKEANQILVMPTFRTWMTYYSKQEFKKTSYYQKFNSLINNKKIIELLEKNNINLIFYPHIEFQKFLDLFNSNSKNIILGKMSKYDVQKLLIESKLLITDYSSVFFDFAYMKKPIIYYQFDYKEYREHHYKKGYFSYEKNGFGPVIDNEKQLITYIEKIFNNNMKLEKIYSEKIDLFFPKRDKNNCKRIYEEINKLENKPKE